MLTLEECRKLDPIFQEMTDAQLLELLAALRALVDSVLDKELN